MKTVLSEELKRRGLSDYVTDVQELIDMVEDVDEITVESLEDMEFMIKDLNTGYSEVMSQIESITRPNLYLRLVKKIGLVNFIALEVSGISVPGLFDEFIPSEDYDNSSELDDEIVDHFMERGSFFALVFEMLDDYDVE